MHGSTGSSRGRGRGPRLWRLRAGSAERPRRGGGGRTVSRTQCSRPSSRRLSMNIGSIKQNEGGIFVGKIETLTIAMTFALREVNSANPKAPKFEVLALSASRAWVPVGALFELVSNGLGDRKSVV